MSSSRNLLILLVSSFAMLALGGCGGGSNAAAPTPGNCAAGQIYSASYGCMNQGGCMSGMAQNPRGGGCISVAGTTISSCQQTNQGVMVYTAQGCLPQGNCPPGQGATVVNGMQGCIPAQTQYQYGYGAGGCSVPGQVMTSKGCLPQGYPCPAGSGVLNNQCFASYAGNNQMMDQPNQPAVEDDDSATYGDDTPCDDDDEVLRYRTVRRVRRHRYRTVFFY